MASHAAHLLRRLVLRPVVTGALVGACALPAELAGAQQQRDSTALRRPLDSAKPFGAFSASAQSLRDSLVQLARAQVGTRYVRGGASPLRGFDCSGLVRYVMAAVKVSMPRTARQQAGSGLAVTRDTTRLRPGDLLTFGTGRRGTVGHIGIYVGNGRYVHASSGTGKVIESDLARTRSPLVRAWRGVRRVVADSAG